MDIQKNFVNYMHMKGFEHFENFDSHKEGLYDYFGINIFLESGVHSISTILFLKLNT